MVDAGAAGVTGARAAASSVCARATRAVRQVLARKPDGSNPDEAAREDVLDEAPEKLHRRQRHRASLVVVGVVLPLKRDALPIEGAQPMIADRHAMGIAPEIPQHG